MTLCLAKITYEETMSTELLQECFGGFDTDINRVEACFFEFLDISDFDSRQVFHSHDLICCEIRVCHRRTDVAEFAIIEVFTTSSKLQLEPVSLQLSVS